jgi:alpha-mannosidase
VACGTEEYGRDGEECVAQKWVGLVSQDERNALAVINDGTYGFDAAGGELRLSLLRSAAHAGHPVAEGVPILRQDRFTPRIDTGERRFRFRIEGGPAAELLPGLDRRALAFNERPMVLCASPPGEGRRPLPWLELTDEAILLTAAKLAEDTDRVVLRLFNPRPETRTTTLLIPPLDLTVDQTLGAYELRTLVVDPDTGEVVETDLLERELTYGD